MTKYKKTKTLLFLLELMVVVGIIIWALSNMMTSKIPTCPHCHAILAFPRASDLRSSAPKVYYNGNECPICHGYLPKDNIRWVHPRERFSRN